MTFTATSPIGFVNFAESYRRAGQVLAEQLRGGGGFDSSPTRYCFYHSIELYLKAVLIADGFNEKQLKNVGHRFRSLVDECNTRGLGLLEATDLMTIDNIDSDGNYLNARYARVGAFRVATLQALDLTAHEVAELTVGSLRKHGLRVRDVKPRLPLTFRLQVH